MAETPNDRIYLVYSREHDAWWGPNHRGYRTLVADAGRYTRAEAVKICDANNKRLKMEEPGPAEEMVIAPEAADTIDLLRAECEAWRAKPKRVRCDPAAQFTEDCPRCKAEIDYQANIRAARAATDKAIALTQHDPRRTP